MNLTNKAPTSDLTNRRHRTLRRSLGGAVLGAVLISTAACGTNSATDAASTNAPPPTSSPSSTNSTSSPASDPAPTHDLRLDPTTVTQPTPSTTGAPDVSTTTPTSTTVGAAATTPRPTATIDGLVDVDGVRLHVRCVGSGDTTVLLISGFEVGDENWGQVEPDIAARARVCSYARPGTGTSDLAGSTQTFTTQAAQLQRPARHHR